MAPSPWRCVIYVGTASITSHAYLGFQVLRLRSPPDELDPTISHRDPGISHLVVPSHDWGLAAQLLVSCTIVLGLGLWWQSQPVGNAGSLTCAAKVRQRKPAVQVHWGCPSTNSSGTSAASIVGAGWAWWPEPWQILCIWRERCS